MTQLELQLPRIRRHCACCGAAINRARTTGRPRRYCEACSGVRSDLCKRAYRQRERLVSEVEQLCAGLRERRQRQVEADDFPPGKWRERAYAGEIEIYSPLLCGVSELTENRSSLSRSGTHGMRNGPQFATKQEPAVRR